MLRPTRHTHSTISSFLTALTTTVLVAGLLLLGGCDSGGAMQEDETSEEDSEPTTTLSGTVTDDGSKALRKGSSIADPVENATVTAVRLNDDGSTTQLDGTTQSNSDGTFELEVKQQTEGATVVVQAEKSDTDFSTSVGVQITDPSATAAQPMTGETDAEAEVATRLNESAGDGEDAAEALADAAALVDNDVASAILSGDTAPSEIADLAQSMDETRENYANDAGANVDESDVADEEQDAYENLQEGLTTASDSADRAQALNAFENAMASSYEEAGASTELQAKIEQAGTQVALEAVDASTLPDAAKRGLERRATVLRAIATGESVESTVDSDGTGTDVTSELKSARSDLLKSVRTASSRNDIQTARSNYKEAVQSNLSDGFDMGSADVQEGFDNLQTALDNLNGALDQAISATGDVNADAVSKAFQNYYENGVQAVQQVYSERGAPAEPAASAAKVTAEIGIF